jgi:hypothetical protein
MTEYQLKALIYDLYCNARKLRELSKDGLLTMNDLWNMQDEAIRLAKLDNLLENKK